MSHVDSTSPITHVSLCAGYGGIDLGLHRAIRNLRTIAVSEIEAFACANLVAKMEAGLLDPAPIWTDLKTFPWSDFRDRVDILSGGYPCQPFSAAGKRLGAEDPRHLWPHISAGIAAMRPAVCFFENVEGHISLGLPDVIEDLGRLGYRATWCVASASECGAPHQRKRVFILAERVQQGLEGRACQQSYRRGLQCEAGRGSDLVWPSRPGEQQFAWEPPRVVVDDASRLRSREPADGRGQAASGADASGEVLANAQATGGRPVAGCVEEASSGEQAEWQLGRTSGCDTEYSDSAMGNAPHTNRRSRVSAEEAGAGPEDIWRRRSGESGERQTQPPLGRDADGPADRLDHAELYTTCDNRTDELRLLGNGVVPAVCECAWRLLVGELMEHQP